MASWPNELLKNLRRSGVLKDSLRGVLASGIPPFHMLTRFNRPRPLVRKDHFSDLNHDRVNVSCRDLSDLHYSAVKRTCMCVYTISRTLLNVSARETYRLSSEWTYSCKHWEIYPSTIEWKKIACEQNHYKLIVYISTSVRRLILGVYNISQRHQTIIYLFNHIFAV